MWYLIKRTVKDPHSPSVLKVQRVVEGEIKEYTVQEDIEKAIQRECEVRFLLNLWLTSKSMNRLITNYEAVYSSNG
jgi:hypothetical protein